MCIALLSTAHPQYKLILIDNRDEFVNRPTAQASWWPSPDEHVLGGRDLLREIQGTWLGVTKSGKIAVLTNYREDQPSSPSATSRGAIIRKFLAEDVGPLEDFVKNIVNTGIARDAGGFSLVCGHVGDKLAVLSNRTYDQSEVPWIAGNVAQTVGLSNATFKDRTWRKVSLGEELMLHTIRDSIDNQETEDQLVDRFLNLLGHDTLPRHGALGEGGLETYITDLRNTIFVPPLGRKSVASMTEDQIRVAKAHEKVQVFDGQTSLSPQKLGVDGVYATQKQTVILVDQEDNVRFFERTLFDEQSDAIAPGGGDVDIRFKIERQ
jgi:uncharacterized protein with NRDE domain